MLDKDWEKHVQEIGAELTKLESHFERAGMLMGCAAVFAREAGLTEEQFMELAASSWAANFEMAG